MEITDITQGDYVWKLWVGLLTATSTALGAWIKKNKDLEIKETELRAANRNKQICELENKIDGKIGDAESKIGEIKGKVDGVSKSFDRHKEEHKEKDAKMQESFDSINKDLHDIKRDLIARVEFEKLKDKTFEIDKNVAKICAILEERAKNSA